MAFKILSNEEISLLNDNQRKQYENKLDLYQQRAAFVERLEILENANIEPYKPKLKPIVVLKKADWKSFKAPEINRLECETVRKPELKINPIKRLEFSKPSLPVSKRPNLQIRQIKRIDRTKPNLMPVAKPTAAAISFKLFERKSPALPKVFKPEAIFKSFKQLKGVKANLPVKTIMNTAIPFHGFGKMKKIKLPNIDTPNIDIASFIIPKRTQLNLPAVSAILPEIKTFGRIEKHDLKLPAVVKPKLSAPGLPRISKISVQPKDFIGREHYIADLPTALQPNIGIRSYESPEYQRVPIPNIQRAHIKVKDFGQFVKIQPDSVAATISLKVPDASLLLLKLFPESIKDTESMEG